MSHYCHFQSHPLLVVFWHFSSYTCKDCICFLNCRHYRISRSLNRLPDLSIFFYSVNNVKDESLILKGDVLWFIVDFNYSFFLLKSWLLSVVPSFCIQVVIKPIWLRPSSPPHFCIKCKCQQQQFCTFLCCWWGCWQILYLKRHFQVFNITSPYFS